MIKHLAYSLIILCICSCEQSDDFIEVTKRIHIQDTITVDEPFDFGLVLRNDGASTMKLTIDENVQKSVQFNMFFHCDDKLAHHKVENPKKGHHKLIEYRLKSNDSLVFYFKGRFRQVGDVLQMEVDGDERVHRIKKPSCDELKVDFGGNWIPGVSDFADSMEGYGFSKRVFVKSQSNSNSYRR